MQVRTLAERAQTPWSKPNQGIHPAVGIFLCLLELAFRIETGRMVLQARDYESKPVAHEGDRPRKDSQLNVKVHLGSDFQVSLWFGGFYSADA
jgi:hypothetical protein